MNNAKNEMEKRKKSTSDDEKIPSKNQKSSKSDT